MAAQLRFGENVTKTYVALSFALSAFWPVALWLAGAYDVRFIGTGSDEFRKVLNAGVSLAAGGRDLLVYGQHRIVPSLSARRPSLYHAIRSDSQVHDAQKVAHASQIWPLHAKRGGGGP